jgi:hypothetical protein
MILNSTDAVKALGGKTVTGGRLNAAKTLAANPNTPAPGGGGGTGGSSGGGGGASSSGFLRSGEFDTNDADANDSDGDLKNTDNTPTVIILRIPTPLFSTAAPGPQRDPEPPLPLIEEQPTPKATMSMRSPTYASGGARKQDDELLDEEAPPEAPPPEGKPMEPAKPERPPVPTVPQNDAPRPDQSQLSWSEASALYFSSTEIQADMPTAESHDEVSARLCISAESALAVALVFSGIAYRQPAARRTRPLLRSR